MEIIKVKNWWLITELARMYLFNHKLWLNKKFQQNIKTHKDRVIKMGTLHKQIQINVNNKNYKI